MKFYEAILHEIGVFIISSIVSKQAESILLEVQPNQPEYAEAKRLLNFFSYFKPIQPTEIPPTSIIREFLGGSSFNY